MVRHKGDKVLVLAGPGTGKTEVLAHRIAHLVKQRSVPLGEILAVTFTRKAAGGMTQRLKDFEELKEAEPRISTLHAESLRILGDIEKEGLHKFLLIGDEAEVLMRDAAEDLQIESAEFGKFKEDVRRAKANNKLPEDITDGNRSFKDFYKTYEQLLAFNKAIDMDGLVVRAVRMLSKTGYELLVRHLLVDEYQDINRAEYRLIRVLAENADGLFVVGDDDQSIYGWRGADPSIIREFQSKFEGAQVEILEESHRCPKHILMGALGVISKDPNYRHKPIRSIKEGSLIHVLNSSSAESEAGWIADWIHKNISRGFIEPRNIVIVSKSLGLAEDVVSEIRHRKIKVTRWRGGGIFTDKIVRDILAYIRVFVDKEDNLALRRCMRNEPGIGKEGIQRLRRTAQKNQLPLWNVVADARKFRELKWWWKPFQRFVTKIEKLRVESVRLPLDEAVHLIANEIGASSDSSVDKLARFAESLPDTDLSGFLKEIHKRRGPDLAMGGPIPDDEENAVALMTMHSAKGLTYDIVFLLGMDEGILPNPNQDVDEQRRLCYVAMTRANKELFMCHVRMRKGPPTAGGFDFPNFSSFILDIPDEHKETISN